MPKQVLKIDKFEGGKNTHFHKKDIPDNAFEEARNVMFDIVGRIRPTGHSENLNATVYSSAILAEEGYGLFSFSHDYTNPATTNLATSPAFDLTGVETIHPDSPNVSGTLWYVDTGTGDNNPDDSEWHFETTYNSSTADDKPSSDSGNNSTSKGWWFDESNNRMDCDQSNAGTPKNLKLYQKVGKPGRAYFIDATIQFVNADGTNVNKIYAYGNKGYSLSTGISNGLGFGISKDADSDGTSSMSLKDIIVLPEDTDGGVGVITHNDANVEVYVTNLDIKEVPSPKDSSYILSQNHRFINLLDTALTTWREDLLPLHTSDLTNSKTGYYIADGNLRVFNADFSAICENKWYGFVERKNFLDTTISTVEGSVDTSSSSGAYIRQWVEEDQQLYPPSTNSHDGSGTYYGDGNPGKVDFLDEGDNQAFTDGTESSDGIKIHIGTLAVTDATYDGTYTFYLSYLYDKSEQESKLFQIGTDTGASGKALFIGVTVDYNNSNGYAFNKRIVGARLYYSDSTDSEGFKYHLLDISFEEGCRKFDDVDYTDWNVETADSVVECPANLIGNTPTDANTAFFQFDNMPKVTWYDVINGYAPDEDTYFRYKTATIASDKLWVGNVGEVDSNGAITNRFSDRIIVSPRGRFDLLPRENFLEVAINDGDEIIKLESYADRLLVFKRKILYIINIGKDGSEFIESEHKFLGIAHPASVVVTEGGVVWASNKGVFVYDGRNLVNIIENKLSSHEWRDYAGVSPKTGYIPHRKQLIVTGDSEGTSFYIYDFQTKSWTLNAAGISTSSNIINVSDSTENFNGDAVFATKGWIEGSPETIGANQVIAPNEDIVATFDADTSVTPNALVAAGGHPAVSGQGAFSIGYTGSELYTEMGISGYMRLYLSNAAGVLVINSSTGDATTGNHITVQINSWSIGNIGNTGDNPPTQVGQQELAEYFALRINEYSATSGTTADAFNNLTRVNQVTPNPAWNGRVLKWARKKSGEDWAIMDNDVSTIYGTEIAGAASAVSHSVQIYIAGVNTSTVNKFIFSIRKYDVDAWNNGSAQFTGVPIVVSHTGGTATDASSGADDNNEKVAIDLRSNAAGHAAITDTLGITVSDVAVAEISTTAQTDVNSNNIYFFSMSSLLPFGIYSTGVYLYETLRTFRNDNVSEVGAYALITKDFDFGYPSVNKKVYKVYISFRCETSFGNYFDSNIRVTYGINGEELSGDSSGESFSTSKSKFYNSTGGLSAFASSSTVTTTLNDADGISDADTSIVVASAIKIKVGDAIQMGTESMLVTAKTSNTLTCQRAYMGTTAAAHSNGATVLIARTDADSIAELKPSSGINNVKSFQLKFENKGQVPAKFEINDITIVYRMKNIK